MRSFKHQPANRRQVFLALSGQIESQLRDAYAKCHEAGETQASLARLLGVDRSTVHKRLTGRRNMTIETIADMVWALGHCIKVSIFDPSEDKTNHYVIIPNHRNSSTAPGQNFIRLDTEKTASSSGQVQVREPKIQMASAN